MMGRWSKVSTSNMKKGYHCGAHIQHEKRLELWKVICRPHIQDKEAWPYDKIMISSKQGRLGSEESLIQCWLALSKMTEFLDRFEDESTR